MRTDVELLWEAVRLGEDSELELKEARFRGRRVSAPARDDLADELAAFANARRRSIKAVRASKRVSAPGVWWVTGAPSRTKPRASRARWMPVISLCTSSVKFFSHAPTTVAAVASRCCVSRSSPVSCRRDRSAAVSAASEAVESSAKP